WAVVFGKANTLAITDAPQTVDQRKEYNTQVKELVPAYPENRAALAPYTRETPPLSEAQVEENQEAAHQLAWFAFWAILVFFGVLLVGFAYLWKRGDLDWARSTAAERAAATPPLPAPRSDAELLAGAGRRS